jgi:uncharacterized protein YecE (DUF72 family)
MITGWNGERSDWVAMKTIAVGTAGWALPAAERHHFGDGASNLARYATRFNCVEINSSFYRRHRADTWRRWAETVPEDFRFSVKLPKMITHGSGLQNCEAQLDEFADDTRGLGRKFAIALIQLAPKHEFDAPVAAEFFANLRSRVSAGIVCEPRHPSWFGADAGEVLASNRVARAAADPAIVMSASMPGAYLGIQYWRLHGSPVIYRSSYDPEKIGALASSIEKRSGEAETWCVFDNTASSAATRNALDLISALSR